MLERVVLAALGGGDRERHQCREALGRRVRVIARAFGRRFYLPSSPFMMIEAVVARLPRGLRRAGVVRKLISPGGGVVAYR